MMTRYPDLEICCSNWLSAKEADKAGADRIEICSALGEGGLTPSAGFIKQCTHNLSLKTHVLIRPRSGDFIYNTEEIEIMKSDVVFCKKNRVDAIVLGFLNIDGSIDKELTKEFIDLAQPMKVTFHRAFDMCKDPFIALEDLISLNIDYLLTSGQKSSALEGAEMIHQLVVKSQGRIQIMAASGVRTHLLKELMQKTNANAYHLSSRININSQMEYRKSSVSMGSQSLDAEYIIESQNINDLIKARKILKT